MSRNLKHVTILAFLISLQNLTCAQVSQERKLIIGVWMAESKNRQLEFKSNGECIEFIPSIKKNNTYSYTVSDTVPICIPGQSIDPLEKGATFLAMTDRKTGLRLCYEINGFTTKTLSIMTLGEGGFTIFNRTKK